MLESQTIPANKDGLFFGWFAKYMDGTVLEEFNEDGSTKPFNLIEKSKVSEFGLYGSGIRVFFDTRDGVIQRKASGSRQMYITPYLEDENGELEVLAPRTDQLHQDIIHYKHFVTYLSRLTLDKDSTYNQALNSPPITDEYYIGYKCEMNTKFGKMHFQNVAIISLAKGVELLRLTFTPKFNFNGKVRVGFNGAFASSPIKLESGQKKEFEMIISSIKPNPERHS